MLYRRVVLSIVHPVSKSAGAQPGPLLKLLSARNFAGIFWAPKRSPTYIVYSIEIL